jgi:integrase
VVDTTLPHLPEVVADMVRLQRLTGMRPAELCMLRPCDIDRSKDVWIYRPATHKTQHLGKERVVFIGPKAQGVLLRYLARDAKSYCFQPRDSEAKRRSLKSQGTREFNDRYVVTAYRRAIHRACDKAFPSKEHRWSPNRLRHSAATEVRRVVGLEAAQVVLGHADAKVTQIYAEKDLTLGVEVARKIG